MFIYKSCGCEGDLNDFSLQKIIDVYDNFDDKDILEKNSLFKNKTLKYLINLIYFNYCSRSDVMKTKIKILLIVFLSAVAIQNACALGVTPARTTIYFEPGLHNEVTLRILNNQNKDMDVIISKNGELSRYVTLAAEVISFTPEEKEKFFTYEVDLPKSIEKPGEHDVEILMVEVPASITQKDMTMVGGRPSVISQLRIKVPYPGKYAEADLYISSSGDAAVFTISISNLGTEDLNLKADISILEENKKIAEIEKGNVKIKSKNNGKITAKWSAPHIGSYQAFARLYYSDKTVELKKDFCVGEVLVEVVDVVVSNFTLGDIAKIDITAKNEWNERITDVYAKVLVKNNAETLAALKTASVDIDALSKKTLTAYWDTKDVDVGVYDLIIKLYYAGKTSEKTVELDIGAVSKPAPKKAAGILEIILVLSALIISILIIRWIYIKRTRKK